MSKPNLSTYPGRLQNLRNRDMITGSIDIPLNAEGRKDATRLGKLFRDSGGLNRIWSSNLQRAYETARLIESELRRHVDILASTDLQPWRLGQFEGMTVKQARPALEYFTLDKPDQTPLPGGKDSTEDPEAFNRLFERTRNFFEPLLREWESESSGRWLFSVHSTAVHMLDGIFANKKLDDVFDVHRMLSKKGGPASVWELENVGLGEWKFYETKPHDGDAVFVVRHGLTDWDVKGAEQ